jgi:hypothetical protein
MFEVVLSTSLFFLLCADIVFLNHQTSLPTRNNRWIGVSLPPRYRWNHFTDTAGARMRLFLDCCGLRGLFDDSEKQYPHIGGRTERLTILPRTCMTFTATPYGMTYTYVGYKRRYWNGHQSYFTQDLIRVAKMYKQIENLMMIKRIDDEIQCFFGETV